MKTPCSSDVIKLLEIAQRELVTFIRSVASVLLFPSDAWYFLTNQTDLESHCRSIICVLDYS
jgi:hypothetical protein